MKPIQFTRHDFNNILNFYDLRSSEFSLMADEEFIDQDLYTGHFTSNTDVIPDFVSAKRVKEIIARSIKYSIKIKKPYPFHEAFVDDSVSLSLKHLYGYAPMIVAACDCRVKILQHEGLPTYIKPFEGALVKTLGISLNQADSTNIECDGKNLFVVYTPNTKLQRELILRIFRKKVRAKNPSQKSIFSLRDRIEFFSSVAENIRSNELLKDDRDIFFHTLMQIWPCGARHRLTSFILMKEKEKDVVGELITWNTRIDENTVRSISGKPMPISSAITKSILEGGKKRTYRFERSPEVDLFVLEGILGYRRRDDLRFHGWPLLVSTKDPSIVVRSNGVSRWMIQKHGGLESIESIPEGSNRAIGTSFIEGNLWKYLYRKDVLFLGLGLGVLQRGLLGQSQMVTIEHSEAVREIFEALYPEETLQMVIEIDDFFNFLQKTKQTWDSIVVDFYDPLNLVLKEDNFKLLLSHLGGKGVIILNKQGERKALEELLYSVTNVFNIDITINELKFNQTVITLIRKTDFPFSLHTD